MTHLLAEPEPDEFTQKIASGFTMASIHDPEELLFPDERDSERTLSIWDDVDWWTGETKDASFFTNPPRKVYESQEFEESVQETRENPELLKTPQHTEQTFTQRRWFQQENGRIPLKRLVKVGGSNYLRADAAQSFKAMKRAAKKDGINITFSSATQSGYRDYATQERLFREKGDSDTGGLAADPGTSNHGWGMAIDIGPEAREWVKQHGAKYGFHGIPNESWHFDYKPSGEMEYQPPRRKTSPRGKTKPLPGRKVGARDLTSTIPVSDPNSFMDAVLSLVHEDIERPEVKGKRFNLEDVPRPKNQDEIVAYARQVAKKYGWTGKQWLALYELGNRESGWDPKAVNPDSGATGIPQLLPSAHDIPKNWKDPRVQIRWMARYISGRYGDPIAALKWHNRENWY